ncbi:hypothetical protein JJB71_12855 [Clostridium perfringens]|uniref:hypothetical protein n=1 Tax=Clostridium perfringens TaxID=1502 RepID=UPI001ABB791C|nr:hypothetical protein [Clostridium perfringens]MBO3398430.1 hypothetical protein [Clostridium perfringens]
MSENYRDYINISKKISLEDYKQYKDSMVISIFLNVLATYLGDKNIELLNPLRVQQFSKYIKLKHPDIFELENFDIYKIIENLEDNISKNSIVVLTSYIEKIMNIWNEYVDNVKSKKITMWCEPVYNIRNPYILNYIPCIGTRIKMSTKYLNKNVKIMYATYNNEDKWCIHNIDVNNEIFKGFNISLDKNKTNILLEINKNKEFETECKIIKGIDEDDTVNRKFTLKTYKGNFPTQNQGYDIPFCLFFNDDNDGLIKIKDFETLRKCLNIEDVNSILISPYNLEYYSYFFNYTVNPALIDYNNLKILYNYPCNIYENKIRIIYGQKYSCSFDNIKNSQIKFEIDEGASFIGEYENVQDFLNYINKDYELSNLLTYYKAIEIKKNNGNYIINPCNKRVEIYKDIDDGFFYFYYGTSAEEICNNNIFTLHGIKSKDKIKNIKVNAKENEYIYYCLPSEFGNCSFSVNGFYGGFEKIKTIKLSGSKYVYYVYRTINKGLGITTVEIE